MKSKHAKQFLRPQAIHHYITDYKPNTYRFMSLWDDNEPYPIEELIIIQEEHISTLKAEYKQILALGKDTTHFLQEQIEKAEQMLKRIKHRQQELAKVKAKSTKGK